MAALKVKIIKFIASFLTRLGVLSVFINIADTWSLKKKADNWMVLPHLTKNVHSRFQILLYHRVNNENNPVFRGIPTKVFEKQMHMLNKYYNVLPLDEIVERAARYDVPPKSVSITFDDGYMDNYKYAFPILKKFGLPATIYLTTGPLHTKTPLWHDRVFDAFSQTHVACITLNGNKYMLRTVRDKKFALNVFLQDIRNCSASERDLVIDELLSKLNISEPNYLSSEKLGWEEVREMSKGNISFGAHTVTHPILTRMSLKDAIDEIADSKEDIEKNLNSPVRLFAYPNGSHDDFNVGIKHALKDMGVSCAVTTLWGTNDCATDFFELRRMWIWDADIHAQLFKLSMNKLFS